MIEDEGLLHKSTKSDGGAFYVFELGKGYYLTLSDLDDSLKEITKCLWSAAVCAGVDVGNGVVLNLPSEQDNLFFVPDEYVLKHILEETREVVRTTLECAGPTIH
jgi:hypothetical protein